MEDKISKANKTTKVVKRQTPILKDDPQPAVAQTQDGRSKRTRKE
jgi:hypothetical protein